MANTVAEMTEFFLLLITILSLYILFSFDTIYKYLTFNWSEKTCWFVRFCSILRNFIRILFLMNMKELRTENGRSEIILLQATLKKH